MKKRKAVVFWMFLFTLAPLLPLFLTPLPTYSAVTDATSLFLPTIFRPQPRYWIQNYWVNQNYVGSDFAELELTSSGDMVLAGYLGDGGSHANGVLAKVEQNGQLLWLKRLNGNHDNYFDDVALAQDGSYWASGRLHFSYASYDHAPWLVRFDSTGTVFWQKTYTPTPFSRAKFTDILPTQDNGLLVVVYDDFYGNTIAKLNSQGDVMWAIALNPPEFATISEMKATPDGGYILVGNLYAFEFGMPFEEYRAWIVKMNADGTVAWQNYYVFTALGSDVWRLTHEPFGVVADSGGYTVAVHTTVNGYINTEITLWILRLNTNGDVVWQKNISGVGDHFSDIVSTQDGGIVIVGSEKYPGGAIYRPWVLKLNGNGNLVWQRLYNSHPNDWQASATSVRETNEGDLIMVGRENYNINFVGLMLIKMSSQGLVEPCSCLINNDGTVAEPLFYDEAVIDPGAVTALNPNNTAFSSTNVEVQTARICPETTGPICSLP